MVATLSRKSTRKTRIGPEDHGRRMTLDQFDHAVGREGYLYELTEGVIEVSEVPRPAHGKVVDELREELSAYRREHPDLIYAVHGPGEAKLLIDSTQAERHPDLSVYLTDPPDTSEVWSIWRPAIVVEVVSASSSKRDYEEKPRDYIEFGVDEYWIVDPAKSVVVQKTRWRGVWKTDVLKPGQKLTTRVLPGLKVDVRKLIAAGK
jgi:Uma2 family endonuclease